MISVVKYLPESLSKRTSAAFADLPPQPFDSGIMNWPSSYNSIAMDSSSSKHVTSSAQVFFTFVNPID